jgi:transcriptional regulator with XRE-family HTH domain
VDARDDSAERLVEEQRAVERGVRIQGLREDRGMKPERLAEVVGVSRRSITAWESGAAITRGHIIALAMVLETTRAYLEHGEVNDDGTIPSGDVVSLVTGIAQAVRDHDQRSEQRARDDAAAARGHAAALTKAVEALVLELRDLHRALATPEPPAEDGRPRQGSLAILPHQAGPAAG